MLPIIKAQYNSVDYDMSSIFRKIMKKDSADHKFVVDDTIDFWDVVDSFIIV